MIKQKISLIQLLFLMICCQVFLGCVADNGPAIGPVKESAKGPVNHPGNDSGSINKGSMTVDRLIELQHKAVDPTGVFKKCKTYIMKQKTTLSKSGVDYPVEIILKYKSPLQVKTMTILNGVIIDTTLYNGKNGWKITAGQKPKKLTGRDLDFIKLRAKMACPSADLRNIFLNIELSEVIEDDIPCYKLVCYPESKELHPLTFFIQQKNHLTKEIHMIIDTAKGQINYTANTDKYSDIKGVKVAEKITTTNIMDGKKLSEEVLTLEEFKWDVNINSSEFELPDELKKYVEE